MFLEVLTEYKIRVEFKEGMKVFHARFCYISLRPFAMFCSADYGDFRFCKTCQDVVPVQDTILKFEQAWSGGLFSTCSILEIESKC